MGTLAGLTHQQALSKHRIRARGKRLDCFLVHLGGRVAEQTFE
jgi:hypothetical protein